MAAVTSARITKFIMTSLKLKSIQTYVWTDSQIVLYWMHSLKKLPPFVAHHIKEIHQLIPMGSWWYCLTSENPADLLTRGFTFDQLASSQLWRHGPKWLPDQEKWPKWEQSPTLHLWSLAGTVVPTENSGPPNTGLHCIITVTNYSTLHKLLAVTAHVGLSKSSNCIADSQQ